MVYVKKEPLEDMHDSNILFALVFLETASATLVSNFLPKKDRAFISKKFGGDLADYIMDSEEQVNSRSKWKKINEDFILSCFTDFCISQIKLYISRMKEVKKNSGKVSPNESKLFDYLEAEISEAEILLGKIQSADHDDGIRILFRQITFGMAVLKFNAKNPDSLAETFLDAFIRLVRCHRNLDKSHWIDLLSQLQAIIERNMYDGFPDEAILFLGKLR